MNESIKLKFLLLNILATNLVMFNHDLRTKEMTETDKKATVKEQKQTAEKKQSQETKKGIPFATLFAFTD